MKNLHDIMDTKNDPKRLRRIIEILAYGRPEERLKLFQEVHREVTASDARERDFEVRVTEYVNQYRKGI
jgi:hypothetical protein